MTFISGLFSVIVVIPTIQFPNYFLYFLVLDTSDDERCLFLRQVMN